MVPWGCISLPTGDRAMVKSWSRNIRIARKHLIRSRRNLLAKTNRHDVVHDLHTAVTQSISAWLVKHQHDPDLTQQGSLYKQFRFFAPKRLAKKISLLNRRINLLDRSLLRLEESEECEITEEQWDHAANICLRESASFTEHIKLNQPLQKFSGEQDDQPFFEYQPGLWIQFHKQGFNKAATQTGKVLQVDGKNIILRIDDRAIKTIGSDYSFAKLMERAQDDMSSPFEKRRAWFDLLPQYRQTPLKEHPYIDQELSLFFTCPCCGNPTLRYHPTYRQPEGEPQGEAKGETEGETEGEPQGEYDPTIYSICILCDWADDWDQDDLNADEVLHGANYDYSLTEARKNFASHNSMYRPGHDPFYGIHNRSEVHELKQRVQSSFDSMVAEDSDGAIYLLWADALQGLESLTILLQTEEKVFPELFTTERDEDGIVHSRVYENKWQWNQFPYRLREWVQDYVAGSAMASGTYKHRCPDKRNRNAKSTSSK